MSTEDASGGGGTTSGGPDHENAGQSVVAVDPDDGEDGIVNRLDAHTGDGVRHRAFTCLVFGPEDRLLLAQRAPDKRLWDTYWDGTVASHPEPGQSQKAATRQRLGEELGVTPNQITDLRATDTFEYKRHYENAGLEWEVCTVLKTSLTEAGLHPDEAEIAGLHPDEAEIAGLLWVDYEHLHAHPEWYRQLRLCPWFEIAMRRDFA